ncbi:glyoxalase [Aquisalibacillus elongatus]|uniref:Catechol 2,3-dioxygenase-like lactoylglutathione lyase family enzyme n=1 Tax=Aquisalibacillus elongatus TaxID=485577 RepID=A0A3N5B072_9BACI|nr:glyoxalase [Aquisalibacillus elongatus]RPF50667.1 catechol 2,3-dioxygenase-like lactoylglutathione lyase family enzyme [Aquisalibacillus elongatus]
MGFTFKQIDHVQLAAPRGTEDQARAFFIEGLGFEEVEKPEALKKNGGVWFERGDIQIHIGIEDPFNPARKAHPALEINGLQELMHHLDQQDIAYQADDKLPGANRIYVNDPFGNRIEILEWT